MNEFQADQMLALLGEIRDEVRGMRSEFDKFTNYGTMDVQQAVDAITGPVGYSLGDLNERLYEVISTIDDMHTGIVTQ